MVQPRGKGRGWCRRYWHVPHQATVPTRRVCTAPSYLDPGLAHGLLASRGMTSWQDMVLPGLPCDDVDNPALMPGPCTLPVGQPMYLQSSC
jgi:hypothetical protein